MSEEKIIENEVVETENKAAEETTETKEEVVNTTEVEEVMNKDLDAMNLAELKEMAKIKGIKGYSKMKKDELIEVLK